MHRFPCERPVGGVQAIPDALTRGLQQRGATCTATQQARRSCSATIGWSRTKSRSPPYSRRSALRESGPSPGLTTASALRPAPLHRVPRGTAIPSPLGKLLKYDSKTTASRRQTCTTSPRRHRRRTLSPSARCTGAARTTPALPTDPRAPATTFRTIFDSMAALNRPGPLASDPHQPMRLSRRPRTFTQMEQRQLS